MKRFIASILSLALLCNAFAPVVWAEDAELTAPEIEMTELVEMPAEPAAASTPDEPAAEISEAEPAPAEDVLPAEEPAETPAEELPAEAPAEEDAPAEQAEQAILPQASAGTPEETCEIMDASDYIFQAGGTKTTGGNIMLLDLYDDDAIAELEALIYPVLQQRETEVHITSVGLPYDSHSQSLIRTAFSNIVNSHPELYYVDSTYWMYNTPTEYTRLVFQLRYADDVIDDLDRQILAAVKKAKSFVLPGMTPLQIAMVLHDYLALNIHYNANVANHLPADNPQVYDVVGALINGDAVCQGYTLAYEMLLNEYGIENSTTSSDAINHIWNQVCLDGYWYNVDVTWDDPVPDLPGRVGHDQFLRTDETFVNHTPSKSDLEQEAEWSRKYFCYDETYNGDDVFWRGCWSAIVYGVMDDTLQTYYLNDEGRIVRQPADPEQDAEIYPALRDEVWYATAEKTSWWPTAFRMVPAPNHTAYLMGAKNIYGMNLDKGRITSSLHTMPDSAANVCYYGIQFTADNQLKLYTGTTPNNSSTLTETVPAPEIPDVEIVPDMYCGDHVTWSLSGGTLTLTGTGATYDYELGDTFANAATPWKADLHSIHTVVIGDGITALGEGIFQWLYSLNNVQMADSVTTIGDRAFYNCDALKSLACGEGVTTIGDSAFGACNMLDAIYLPAGVTSIAANAFSTKLNDVYFGGSPTQWKTLTELIRTSDDSPEWDRNLSTARIHCLADGLNGDCSDNCGDDVSWTLEDGVLTLSGTGDTYDYNIGNSGYHINPPWYDSASYIRKVVVGEGITGLGEGIFRNPSNSQLSEVQLPSTLLNIRKMAFNNAAISTLSLGNKVQSIGAGAFSYCDNLSAVYLPASLTNLDGTAFSGIYDLSTVVYGGSQTQWNTLKSKMESQSFWQNSRINIIYNGTGLNTAIASGTAGTIRWKVTADRKLVLSGSGAIPANSNPPWSTYGSQNRFDTLVIEQGITGMTQDILRGADYVKVIELPASFTSLNGSTLAYMTHVKEFRVAEANPALTAVDGSLFSKDLSTMIHYAGNGAYYNVPDSVRRIDDYCFFDRTYMSVNLPEGLESIGAHAFAYCRGLNPAMSFPQSLKRIEENAFHGAFESSTGAVAITLPNHLEYLDQDAFPANTRIRAFVIEDGDKYTAIDGVLYESTASGLHLMRYPAGKTGNVFTAPEGLTSMAQQAFSGNDYVTTVIFPAGFRVLPTWAFTGASQLKRLYIASDISKLEIFFAGIPGDKGDAPALDIYFGGTFQQWKNALTPTGSASVTGGSDVSWADLLSSGYLNVTLQASSEQAAQAGAADPVYIARGDCGERGSDIKWTLDEEGTLNVFGSGQMCSYNGVIDDVRVYPWYDYRDQVKTVRIKGNIDNIVAYAFAYMPNLTLVDIRTGVGYIQTFAFYNDTKLTTIGIPRNINKVGYQAFTNCPLTDVYYSGTEAMKESFDIAYGNSTLENAAWHCSSYLPGLVMLELDNVPDPEFRAILSVLDNDMDTVLDPDELSACTALTLNQTEAVITVDGVAQTITYTPGYTISSLEGIGALNSLETLQGNIDTLTDLDLSGCISLTSCTLCAFHSTPAVYTQNEDGDWFININDFLYDPSISHTMYMEGSTTPLPDPDADGYIALPQYGKVTYAVDSGRSGFVLNVLVYDPSVISSAAFETVTLNGQPCLEVTLDRLDSDALLSSLLNRNAVYVLDANDQPLRDGQFVGTGCSIHFADDPDTYAVVVIPGDIDGNGCMNMNDIVLARRAVLGQETFSGLYLAAATPASGAAKPTLSDVTAMRRYCLGVTDSLRLYRAS